MLKFERFEGPFGIPVFYQQLPEFVKHTAIALTVFTGSADDTSVGNPGLYHWFEHVPFRGTRKFPDGYKATKGPVTRVAGSLNAWTSSHATNYKADVPTRYLDTGLDIVVDLVAQPLMTEEAIAAERVIISQEIRDKWADVGKSFYSQSRPMLWGGHVLAQEGLGTSESLEVMTPSTLYRAREKGYDRSRMTFFISTALSRETVFEKLEGRFDLLPAPGLSERRRGASYGLLPWEEGRDAWETDFTASIVAILFRMPPVNTIAARARASLLCALFSHGGLGSPLYSAVREKNPLAYGASMAISNSLDGGYIGFRVKTSVENVEKVEVALRNMFDDPQIYSKAWFEDIKVSERADMEMEVLDPEDFVAKAVGQVLTDGAPWSEEEMVEAIEAVPHDEVIALVEDLRQRQGHTLIARGTGSAGEEK